MQKAPQPQKTQFGNPVTTLPIGSLKQSIDAGLLNERNPTAVTEEHFIQYFQSS